jgi:hypothetical protein
MLARARCVACGEMFSGSREETFRWLRYHRTLHALQATAVQRFAADHTERIDEEYTPATCGPRAR